MRSRPGCNNSSAAALQASSITAKQAQHKRVAHSPTLYSRLYPSTSVTPVGRSPGLLMLVPNIVYMWMGGVPPGEQQTSGLVCRGLG